MRCYTIVTSNLIKIVSSRNRKRLRKEAYMLRMRFGLDKVKKFPVVEFLELVMPQIDEEFTLVLVEDDELMGRAAETIPVEHMIRVKQSVYDAACQGSYWARTVMAHELGHYVLHGEDTVAYAHEAPGERVPDDINAERQADIFAAELLAPVHLVDETSDYLVSKHFGITRGMARSQMNQVRRVQKRHQRKHQRKKKENG